MKFETRLRVWIVRHGETQANRDGIIQGQLDVPLNEEGLQQAKIVGRALKERLGDDKFDCAYTSDLSRASKTAEMILEHHPGVEAVKDEALRERYMGVLQGQHFSGYKDAMSDGSSRQTVETAASFEKRAVGWWNKKIVPSAKLSDEVESSGVKNILMTSHGGFIGTLVQGLIGSRKVSYGKGVSLGSCKNTAICVICVDSKGKGVLLEYGNVQHLFSDRLVQQNVDVVNDT